MAHFATKKEFVVSPRCMQICWHSQTADGHRERQPDEWGKSKKAAEVSAAAARRFCTVRQPHPNMNMVRRAND